MLWRYIFAVKYGHTSLKGITWIQLSFFCLWFLVISYTFTLISYNSIVGVPTKIWVIFYTRVIPMKIIEFLFYFQLYELEQRSWMVSKPFFFWNYFLVKIFVFFGHTYLCFFSNLGKFLEINYFWPNITTGSKKICTSDIPHISQEPHECGKLSEVQIFLVQKKSKIASGSLFFTKSAISSFLTQYWYYNGKEERKSWLQLYHPYHKNLTSVARNLGSRSF